MIPEFPEFKKLELSDKQDVNFYTKKYPPYVDFGFMGLWCWNIHDKAELSQLNGNLVIKFTDYISNEIFYSFLGETEPIETANRIFELCRKEKAPEKLRALPEVSSKKFESNGYVLLEDRDNFDYVYDTGRIIGMEGNKFRQKRQQAQFFEENFKSETRELDLKNPETRGEIVNLFHNWSSDKIEKIPSYFFQNEFKALVRFLDFDSEILGIGIYVDGKMVATSLSEKVDEEYAIGHFQKALANKFKGLNVYLTREMARLLKQKGIKYHNCEQDLGIPGLRQSKLSYVPEFFLKKYTLSRVVAGI